MVVGISWSGRFCVYVRSFLLASCGLGEGQVAPVYAKVVTHVVFAPELDDFFAFGLADLSGLLAGSLVSPGAFWVLLGASGVAPGYFLGAS